MKGTRAKPLVLHVDDSDVARYAVGRVLRSAGYQVREERTGAGGLEAARALRPDLVVLDVDLPDLSGIEVCRLLRRSPSTARTPVLHLSGARVAPGDRAAGLETGADAYLVQPVDPVELVAVVRALLRTRRAEEQQRRLERALRRSVRAREEALWAVWHELGEPLSTLDIALSGLRAALGDDGVVARERVATALAAAARLRGSVAEMLELARLDSRRAAPRAQPERVASVLAAVVPGLVRLAAEARAELHVPDPAPELAVVCDPAALGQALRALLSAALRGASGARITLRVLAEGGRVRFSVQGGAARTWNARALAPFWEARAAGRRDSSRALALARAVAEAHGGELWLGEDGEGARTVELALPAAGAPAPR